VLRKADLVLLKISDAPKATPLQADMTAAPLNEQLSTLGYAMQILTMGSFPLQLRYGGKFLKDILPQSAAYEMRKQGSPSMDLEIDNIDGHLQHGLSGAPIFNERRKVIAVADGGLDNGAADINWAIPAKMLNELSSSTDTLPASQSESLLFASEEDSTDKGEVTCSGMKLVNTRKVSFMKASATADDPRGLRRLLEFFAVDPKEISFDVYQHLESGATFAVPAGAALQQAPNGTCFAKMPSGMVRVVLPIGTGSFENAQQAAKSITRALIGPQPQGWRADPNWTYPSPKTRWDGMLVDRHGFVHGEFRPPIFPEGYVLETFSARSNVYMGLFSVYSMTPAFQQHFAQCRSRSAVNCDDAREFAYEWIEAALAVGLTTFPIG